MARASLAEVQALGLQSSLGYMLLHRFHKPVSIWIHWVIACAAGCGALGFSMELLWQPPNVELNRLATFEQALFVLILQIACVAAVCAAQQLILEQAGRSAASRYPAVLTGGCGGAALGFFTTFLCALFVFVTEMAGPPYFIMQHFLTFSIGSVVVLASFVAFAQTLEFQMAQHRRVGWATCNGLAACLVLGSTVAIAPKQLSVTQIAMLMGLSYGVLTATALAWIVPLPKDSLGQRKSFLRGPLPRRIDWSFCNELGNGPNGAAFPSNR